MCVDVCACVCVCVSVCMCVLCVCDMYIQRIIVIVIQTRLAPPAAGRRFTVSKSRLHYYQRIVSFPQQPTRWNALSTVFHLPSLRQWQDLFSLLCHHTGSPSRMGFKGGNFKPKSSSSILQVLSCRFFGCDLLVCVFLAFRICQMFVFTFCFV